MCPCYQFCSFRAGSLGRFACPCWFTCRRFPAVESWILWLYGRCNSRNLQKPQASRCFKHALGCTTLWCFLMKTGVCMRGTSFCQSVLAFNLTLSFLVFQGDFSSLDWSRWATKNEQVASLWFVLTHPQGIAPLSEEHALQFTPHSPRFFYTSVGSTFGFSVSERCALWQLG